MIMKLRRLMSKYPLICYFSINVLCIFNVLCFFRSWSEKYTQRKDSKAVQCSYGPTTDFKRTSTYNLSIENLNNGPKPDVMYMFEIMGKKAGSINLMTQQIGHAILATNALTLSEGPLKLNWVSLSNLMKQTKKEKHTLIFS